MAALFQAQVFEQHSVFFADATSCTQITVLSTTEVIQVTVEGSSNI